MTAKKAQTWGIYDEHLRAWLVAPTLPRERDAWAELLAVESLHPWELRVRAYEGESSAALLTECPECYSTGECDGCGRECLRCDGDGEVPWEDLAEFERESQKRRGVAPKGVAS